MADRTYFTRVVDDEGNENYVAVDSIPVDLSTVEDEQFFNDPRYQSVADRDYQRRQKVKELQTQLDALTSDNTEDEDDSGENQTVVNVDVNEEFERLWAEREQQLTNTLLSSLEQRQREQAQQQARLQETLDKHKLPATLLPVLQLSDDPDTIADTLARAGLKFGGDGGGDSEEDRMKSLFSKIDSQLGLND